MSICSVVAALVVSRGMIKTSLRPRNKILEKMVEVGSGMVISEQLSWVGGCGPEEEHKTEGLGKEEREKEGGLEERMKDGVTEKNDSRVRKRASGESKLSTQIF